MICYTPAFKKEWGEYRQKIDQYLNNQKSKNEVCITVDYQITKATLTIDYQHTPYFIGDVSLQVCNYLLDKFNAENLLRKKTKIEHGDTHLTITHLPRNDISNTIKHIYEWCEKAKYSNKMAT